MDQQIAVAQLVQHVKDYADGRAKDLARGAETPRLAALLLQKYGRGLIDAVVTIFDNPRVADPISEALDDETAKIDPQWRKHNQQRWEGRPADVLTNTYSDWRFTDEDVRAAAEPTTPARGSETMEERRIGRFFIRQDLFEEVKKHMETALHMPVSDEVAEPFLARHPSLLGSIVGHDEVDTEDRSMIWECCRSDFPSSR